MTNNHINLRLF